VAHIKTCKHCGNATFNRKRFCCLGCKTAYLLIHQLELEDYYKIARDKIAPPLPPVKIDYSKFIQDKTPMQKEIELLIEGLRCGSCLWLVESALRKEPEVLEAFIVNNKLKLVWEGNQETLNKFIKIIEKLGYRALPFEKSLLEENQHKTEKNLLVKLSLAGFIWIQTMMISMGLWFGEGEISSSSRILMNIFSGIITIPTLLYSGNVFFKSAWAAVKMRQSHMDIPISLAIIITLLVSLYGTFIASNFVFYEAAASLVFALLVGRYFDVKIRFLSRKYAENFILTKNPFVTVFREGIWQKILTKEVRIGEKLLVVYGERIALDATLLSDKALLDNSIITGETDPVTIKQHDKVFAGAINISQTIELLVEKDEDHSLLSEIKSIIEKSQNQKSRYQDLASFFAKIYTPVVLFFSIMTSLVWSFLIPGSQAILYGVSVLVITCPCALGLAVPLVHSLGISLLMKKGIFIKSDKALEKLSQVELLVLDKTGILTFGKPQLLNLEVVPKKFIPFLKSVALGSQHHLCQAIVAATEVIQIRDLLEVEEIAGEGVKARLGKLELFLGRETWLGFEPTNELEEISSLFMIKEGEEVIFSAKLFFSDQIRPEAKDFIQIMKKRFNKAIILLSGDTQTRVAKLAKELQIDHYLSEQKPQDKHSFIAQQKTKVLMVGDGLNDAAALSLAFASATPSGILELSQKQADLVFQKSLLDLVFALDISKKVNRLAKENIFMASLYNIISIPFAILGYATPFMAALFMGISSLFVIINSLLRIK
jgi:Cu2+-exporting ATPase